MEPSEQPLQEFSLARRNANIKRRRVPKESSSNPAPGCNELAQDSDNAERVPTSDAHNQTAQDSSNADRVPPHNQPAPVPTPLPPPHGPSNQPFNQHVIVAAISTHLRRTGHNEPARGTTSSSQSTSQQQPHAVWNMTFSDEATSQQEHAAWERVTLPHRNSQRNLQSSSQSLPSRTTANLRADQDPQHLDGTTEAGPSTYNAPNATETTQTLSARSEPIAIPQRQPTRTTSRVPPSIATLRATQATQTASRQALDQEGPSNFQAEVTSFRRALKAQIQEIILRSQEFDRFMSRTASSFSPGNMNADLDKTKPEAWLNQQAEHFQDAWEILSTLSRTLESTMRDVEALKEQF